MFSTFAYARDCLATLPRLDLTGPRSSWQGNRYLQGFAKPLQVARTMGIKKWVQRSAAQAGTPAWRETHTFLSHGAKRVKQILGKTCAKHVATTRQNRGITFHNSPTNPQAQKFPAFLSPAKHPAFTHNRTHFLHSFVDKITEVKSQLSKTSTAPTTTITTYI